MSDIPYVTKEDVKLVMGFEAMLDYAKECAGLISSMEGIVTRLEGISKSYVGVTREDGMYYGQGSETIASYVAHYTDHLCQITIYLQMCQSYIDICNNTVLNEDKTLQGLIQAVSDFCVSGGGNG